MEDLDVMETKADEIHTVSKKYGLKYNFKTDDERVDKITMEGTRTSAKV